MLSKLLKCCGNGKKEKKGVEMKNETLKIFFISFMKKNIFLAAVDKEKRKNQFINGFKISVCRT